MLVPEHIEKLQAYQAGRSIEAVKEEYRLAEVVKLGSNENPLGPSPKAMEAIRQTLSEIFRYPDVRALRLRTALAEKFKVKVENCIVGNGSEGIMSAIMGTFLHDKDEVLTASCTFIGFFVLTHARGVKLRTVPLKDGRFDLERMGNAITPNTKIIFLCNPNNPTGTIFTRKEFEAFMKCVPDGTLVILDEAYAEFALDDPEFPDSMHYRLDNCITLRTFSKLYGLAGIRIGYGFAHEDLIKYILKVKLPFEPNILAQAAAVAALNDHEFIQQTLETVKKGKAFLFESFQRLGLNVLPSHANFLTILFKSEEEVNHVFEVLLQNGVITRPLKNFGLKEGLRITIGKEEENLKCVRALEMAVRQPRFTP
jgi:histidinol-phosphate aminotransferase